MKQIILVTGANGQLGQELKVFAPSFAQYDFIFLSREELSISDPAQVQPFFVKHKPAYLINCAAYTAVDKAESEKDQAFLVNAASVGVLAKACKENDTRFIHISTDYVFNGNANVPYKEDAFTDPQSVYGASKLEGEKLALQYNPDSIIIRTSWVYSVFGKNFVKTMLKLMGERDELNVVSDQIGSPTHAADLAEAILKMIEQLPTPDSRLPTKSGIYHFSNAGIISWYDFAVAIKELSGGACKINPIATAQYPTPAKRPAYSVFDKTKIQEDFGIELRNWKKSLEVCIERLSS